MKTPSHISIQKYFLIRTYKLIKSSILLTFFFASTFSYAAVELNKTAPNFSLQNADQKSVSLSDFAGKYVVLEWTNHDCPFVKKHYGSNNMQTLQKKYAEKDVVWLSIISSAPGKQGHIDSAKSKELTSSRSAMPRHVLFDPEGKVGRDYGAKTTPHMYIIDKKGVLKYNGAIDSIKSANPADIEKAVNYVDLAFNELVAGKPLSKPFTRPYGCGVKY